VDVDETRSLTEWEFAASVADYLQAATGRARIDCWAGAPPPLLLCESRTFGGVLGRTLAPEFLCPIAATNGQVGGFLHTNIVPTLAGNERRVLYIGDLDHQGTQIETNTQRVLVQEAGERDWRRIALTAEQAEAHGLESIEKLDKRYNPPRRGWAIEVESLGPGGRDRARRRRARRAAARTARASPNDEQAQRDAIRPLLETGASTSGWSRRCAAAAWSRGLLAARTCTSPGRRRERRSRPATHTPRERPVPVHALAQIHRALSEGSDTTCDRGHLAAIAGDDRTAVPRCVMS
jgi:hypothetical protein